MVNFYIEKSVNGVSVDLDGTDVRVLGSCLNIPLGLVKSFNASAICADTFFLMLSPVRPDVSLYFAPNLA